MDFLCAHDWPGNVRELENAIERAATLCEGDIIQASDLPPNLLVSVKAKNPSLDSAQDSSGAVTLPAVPETALYPLHPNNQNNSAQPAAESPGAPLVPLKTFLREQEQTYLNRVLEQCGGDKERAAIELGVSLATLYRKMSGEDRD
jgi:DNA-binding NtrC family response regulator